MKIKIAVGVEPSGYWFATGYNDVITKKELDEKEVEHSVRECLADNSNVYWIEADIPDYPHIIKGKLLA